MDRALAVGLALTTSLTASFAFAQAGPGSTGALPPVQEPTTPPPAQPAPPAVPAQPALPAQPAPPPAYPAPQPGYYAPPAYAPYGGYPPPAPAPPPEPPTRSVSLTLSPIHLLLPVVELTLEARIADHFGVAVLGGFGTVSAETTDEFGRTESERFDAYELGGQAIWYPSEAFDELEVGVELLYMHVSSEDIEGGTVSGIGSGWALGPMVGYKVLTTGGFTFVAQGGLQYAQIEAEVTDDAGNRETETDSRWLPLLNLNLGWSF